MFPQWGGWGGGRGWVVSLALRDSTLSIFQKQLVSAPQSKPPSAQDTQPRDKGAA